VSLDNQAPANDYYARNYLNPDGESGKHAAYGGLLRDRPLGRDPLGGDWALADFETEVRQAVAAGLDGFTVDILSLTSAHWTRVQKLITAAENVDPGFSIVLMPDMNGLASAGSDAFASAMAQLAASDSVYRLGDGRVTFLLGHRRLPRPGLRGARLARGRAAARRSRRRGRRGRPRAPRSA
jgi:hypothetical protein